MLKYLWLLALATPMVLLVGCGDEPADDDDDDDDTPAAPILVEVSPEFGQTDFFYRSSLVAEFNAAPESVTITLTDSAGAEIAGEQTIGTNGRVVTFDPSEDLMSSAGYTMTVEWAPSDEDGSPFVNAFQTGAHGTALENPADMIGTVYNIDLAGATFVDPPGIGPILQSQIDGIAVLFTPIEEGTDFDAGELHVMGAIGDEEGNEIAQDLCSPTLAFTNPDGILGNEDDTPATWDNPDMLLEADLLPLSIQGITAEIQDLVISGTFDPDLSNMRGGVFGGIIDTRPLVGALGSGESESEICDLVSSTVGVDCIECTEGAGDNFCLSVRAEDLSADMVDGLTLEPRPCEVIIADTACEDEAAAYDSNGDGTYDLCPAFVAP